MALNANNALIIAKCVLMARLAVNAIKNII